MGRWWKRKTMIDLTPFIERETVEIALYVSGVVGFITRLDTKDGLETSELRAKPPGTYIRNMLAVAVLSRLMREEFVKTRKRVIVLPGCLKQYGDWTCCKADLDGGVYTCTQCHPGCLVYETVERFCNTHTTLVFDPEDMDAYFAGLRKNHGTVGVAGVACALTMLSGFDKTIKYKHPTQGVFLNYSSCDHHWAKPGYNTCYSLRRMAWVLGKNDPTIKDVIRERGETYSMEKGSLSPDDFYRRLDGLADRFESEYLPQFRLAFPAADVFALSQEIRKALVHDLVTRNSM